MSMSFAAANCSRSWALSIVFWDLRSRASIPSNIDQSANLRILRRTYHQEHLGPDHDFRSEAAVMQALTNERKGAIMDRRSVLLALAGVVSAAPMASAQPLLPASPDQFRLSELMGGEFAILTSRLALERSRNPNVRNFAQLEINEQTAIAAALGATPGTVQPRPDQLAIVQQLQGIGPGRQFDRAYVEGQLAGREELLALNTAYAQGGSDQSGRAVATVAVPSIQTHLSILSNLRRNGLA